MFSGISNFFGKNTPTDPLQPLRINREKKVVDAENIALKWLSNATFKMSEEDLGRPVEGAIITTLYDDKLKKNFDTYVFLDAELKNEFVEGLLSHATKSGITNDFKGNEFAVYQYFLARLAIAFEKDEPQVAKVFKEAEHIGNLRDSYILKNAASEMVKILKDSNNPLDKNMLNESSIWKQI
jgi:hypothetical protein